jgi:hypothetical protein
VAGAGPGRRERLRRLISGRIRPITVKLQGDVSLLQSGLAGPLRLS